MLFLYLCLSDSEKAQPLAYCANLNLFATKDSLIENHQEENELLRGFCICIPLQSQHWCLLFHFFSAGIFLAHVFSLVSPPCCNNVLITIQTISLDTKSGDFVFKSAPAVEHLRSLTP